MDKTKFNDRKEWRTFAVGLGLILGVIGGVMLLKGSPNYIWLFVAHGASMLIGLLCPVLIKPLFIGFSYLGFGMGWVMTRVILFILFYLVLTPISLLARLVGKRFLDLKFDRQPDSYWLTKQAPPEGVKSFENQF